MINMPIYTRFTTLYHMICCLTTSVAKTTANTGKLSCSRIGFEISIPSRNFYFCHWGYQDSLGDLLLADLNPSIIKIVI